MKDKNAFVSDCLKTSLGDSSIVLRFGKHALLVIAFFCLFPYGFFLVQAFRRTQTWMGATFKTVFLLVIHVLAISFIIGANEKYQFIIQRIGFLLLALNIWFGYDWQVRNMTNDNGYADWQRALRWIGFLLKVLTIGILISTLRQGTLIYGLTR